MSSGSLQNFRMLRKPPQTTTTKGEENALKHPQDVKSSPREVFVP